MCSGFLFRRGPLMPAPIPYSQRGGTRSDVAPAPPPPDVGWMDGISASFRASVYDQPGYMDGQRRVAYQSLLDAIQPYAATPLAERAGSRACCRWAICRRSGQPSIPVAMIRPMI
jgi:hypothetical protein